MTRERVDEMLKLYRFELGRSGHLLIELQELEREIAAEEKAMLDDVTSIGGQNLDGMPRGTKIGDPTGNAGAKLADGYKSDHLLDLEEKWIPLKAAYDRSQVVVGHVDAWLSGLNERERWVIEKQVIDCESWRDIISKYRDDFKEKTSKYTLKRLREKAMEKVYLMAQ